MQYIKSQLLGIADDNYSAEQGELLQASWVITNDLYCNGLMRSH